MISKGEASEFLDFREIGRCGILDTFDQLSEVKKKAFLDLVNTFTGSEPDEIFNITEWIYLIVFPEGYNLWVSYHECMTKRDERFHQLVENEEKKSENAELEQIQRDKEKSDTNALDKMLSLEELRQESNCLDMELDWQEMDRKDWAARYAVRKSGGKMQSQMELDWHEMDREDRTEVRGGGCESRWGK